MSDFEQQPNPVSIEHASNAERILLDLRSLFASTLTLQSNGDIHPYDKQRIEAILSEAFGVPTSVGWDAVTRQINFRPET